MLGTDKVCEWNLFDIDYISSVISADLKFTEIFYFLLKKRILHIIIFVLVCFSTIKEKLLYGIVAWFGLTFGIILGALYILYGFKGIWIFIIGIMIHILIYIMAAVTLLQLCSKTDKSILSGGYLLCFMLFFLGIIAEALLNWGVFPKIMSFYC